MKILSVIVPCYNSQDYLQRCIDSLLVGGKTVEIIIVNDGSTDNTAAIADSYHNRYPQTIKVLHQKNKGHGGAINTGLQHACGVFAKVVDSDDWVNITAYKKILKTLSAFPQNQRPDVFVSNYVYEKVGKRRKTSIGYENVLPQGRIFTWQETGHFRIGQYLLMHALIYRLDILQKSHLCLPEHTFYVDNIYAYTPLAYTETLYYLNVDFYRYYIGRSDQSIHEKTMIQRIDQQLAVNKEMIDSIDLKAIPSNKKRRYLVHYLEIVTGISSILLMKEGSKAAKIKKKKLWLHIKKKDATLYDRLRTGLIGQILHPRSPFGRHVAITVYKISRMIVGFS